MNSSDITFGNGADPDGENFLASKFATGLQEAFCLIGIAGEIPTAPGEPNSVKEASEGPGIDESKNFMAEELGGLSEKGILREGPTPKGRVSVKMRCVLKLKRSADDAITR